MLEWYSFAVFADLFSCISNLFLHVIISNTGINSINRPYVPLVNRLVTMADSLLSVGTPTSSAFRSCLYSTVRFGWFDVWGLRLISLQKQAKTFRYRMNKVHHLHNSKLWKTLSCFSRLSYQVNTNTVKVQPVSQGSSSQFKREKLSTPTPKRAPRLQYRTVTLTSAQEWRLRDQCVTPKNSRHDWSFVISWTLEIYNQTVSERLINTQERSFILTVALGKWNNRSFHNI